MATESENSGMGVVLGVLLAIVLAIGAYFIIANNNGDVGVGAPRSSVEMPDVNINNPPPATDDVP